MLQSEVISSFLDFNFQGMKMPMITVYNNPIDFKGKYVARLFDLDSTTPYCILKDSLEEIYEEIPVHLTRIERHPTDDPIIVCTFF